VGSLRFLRTQEALVSDLNSRNSQAEKQRTGESGSLSEVRRTFLQYDFPDYCTGQVPMGGAGGQRQNRRALGHGNLAEKALIPVLPSSEAFPYAARITAETVDSNGSSSMASICGSFMALLDAGVPVVAPVAGISVGLAMLPDNDDDGNNKGSSNSGGTVPPHTYAHGLLLDITGTEDYYGAMDFKVGGTRDAVTALQLDVKDPVDCTILVSGLQLAQAGRRVVLEEMEAQRREQQQQQQGMGSVGGGFVPRSQPKLSAPAVEVIKFDASRKRDLIGPGGVVLRQLEERYNVSVDLTQEGRCLLYGEDRSLVAKAKATVMDLVADVVVGEIYQGTIVELKDFGAIVELLRNKEGILHVSELTDEMEARDHPEGIAGFVREYLKVGETIDVLCTGVDQIQGSIKLSRKAVLRKNRPRQS
jgi:polyribonucleotide nucleotidyltransferase